MFNNDEDDDNYLDKATGESDSLVSTVDHFTPEPDKLSTAVRRAVKGGIKTDRARRTGT